jgi:hypothetical protein
MSDASWPLQRMQRPRAENSQREAKAHAHVAGLKSANAYRQCDVPHTPIPIAIYRVSTYVTHGKPLSCGLTVMLKVHR